MENFIIYFPVFMAVLLAIVLIGRYIFNCFADDKTERKLEIDKESADRLLESIIEKSSGFADCKEKSDRITEHQQRITERIDEATRAVSEAKGRSEESVDLIDECLSILEEAEKTSKQS